MLRCVWDDKCGDVRGGGGDHTRLSHSQQLYAVNRVFCGCFSCMGVFKFAVKKVVLGDLSCPPHCSTGAICLGDVQLSLFSCFVVGPQLCCKVVIPTVKHKYSHFAVGL